MGRALVALRQHWVAIGLLCLLAWGAHASRRAVIRAFFGDSAPIERMRTVGPKSVELVETASDGFDVQPAGRVRVVLLDGLGRTQADRLPGLRKVCARGVRTTVDVGFPTVSLPVQHVLWTGKTQQQTGVAYRIEGLTSAPESSLPAAVPGSIAVAESHPEIVHSFGFDRVIVASHDPNTPANARDEHWRAGGFEAAAIEAVASESALAFVHVLRIDEAGHRSGAESVEYMEAATWADDFVTRLAAAAPSARWVVMSDHGHRPGGGHGGAEPEIRVVRACLFGDVEADDAERELHLVDLSRALFASVGAPVPSGTYGRAWSQTVDAHTLSLPRPGPGRWAAALTLLGMAFAVAVVGRARGILDWPWWPALAVASLVAVRGVPTLSHPMIYPPLGLDMHLAASPGYLLAAFVLRRHARAVGQWRAGLLQFAIPLAVCVAMCMLCGGLAHFLSGGRYSLLIPDFTAWTSVALALLAGASAFGAFALVVPSRGQRSSNHQRGVEAPTRRAPPAVGP